MNNIFIIGNGFDLAHGYATSYSQFFLHFLKKRITDKNEDEFIKITADPLYLDDLLSAKTLDDFLKNKTVVSIIYKSILIQHLITKYQNARWVDVEYLYFKLLKNASNGTGSEGSLIEYAKKLNQSFNHIKNNLFTYLQEVEDHTEFEFNKEIADHINKFKNAPDNSQHKNIFINFNYTSLIREYVDISEKNIIIDIHGSLKNGVEDLIFGYGDEMDPMVQKLEYLYDNELLINLKTFGYFKNNYLQQIRDYLDKDEFNVIIMGHSCGISDRLLLSDIFNNKNCINIHLFYHEKNERENDLSEKIMEIYRHFDSSNKRKISSKLKIQNSKPLIKFQKTQLIS